MHARRDKEMSFLLKACCLLLLPFSTGYFFLIALIVDILFICSSVITGLLLYNLTRFY